jgi:hypothetical protein
MDGWKKPEEEEHEGQEEHEESVGIDTSSHGTTVTATD